jgi:MFS family permease
MGLMPRVQKDWVPETASAKKTRKRLMAMELPAETAREAAATDTTSRTLFVICSAHWLSHFHLWVLPLLFPFLIAKFGGSFVELSLALTIAGVMSALTQAPVGSLCDRFGGRKILTAGVVLGSCAFILLGLWLNYVTFLIAGALIGLANSVYHPADYALLSANVDEAKIGKAFSIHTCAGFVGSAAAPAIIAAMVWMFAGQGALIAAGVIGLVVAAILIFIPIPEATAASTGGSKASSISLKTVLTLPILMLATGYVMMRLSNGGIESYSLVALIKGYSIDYSTASIGLTGYASLTALGVLTGGYLADKTDRHGTLAAISLGISGCFVLAIAFINMPAWLLVTAMGCAGFFNGIIMPSRDMLVRKAAPPGTAGRAFGIVSTGFSIGAVIGPLVYGSIMDHGSPHWIFATAAGIMVITMTLILLTERRQLALINARS